MQVNEPVVETIALDSDRDAELSDPSEEHIADWRHIVRSIKTHWTLVKGL